MDQADQLKRKFSAQQLRQRLLDMSLPINGNKIDLVNRLNEADPEGLWIEDLEKEDGYGDEGACSLITLPQREKDLLMKEKELMQKELELARREIEMLKVQQMNNVSNGQTSMRNSPSISHEVSPRMSVMQVADLLSYFDGNPERYETWIQQVKFLRSTYKISNEEIKVIIGSRLKGKAFEWLHSKPEYISMDFDNFVSELEGMFYHKPSKIKMRKQFEDRVWRKEETFAEYMHEKMILANRTSINDDELIDYIIEGIPNSSLRDQAYIQRIKTRHDLLEAFEKVTLYDRQNTSGVRGKIDNKLSSLPERERFVKKDEGVKNRCFNCGLQNHISANCPMKHKGTKCFECKQFGHIAVKCPKKVKEVKDNNCRVINATDNKCRKTITIGNRELVALIDTGSDLSLMRAEQYINLGSPRLLREEIIFRGVGSEDIKSMGSCTFEITIDGECYQLTVHIVSDTLMKYPILIGNDFLNKIELCVKNGSVKICKAEIDNIPEIFKLDYVMDESEIDLSYITSTAYRNKVAALINNYNPVKSKEVGVNMKLILKDDQPVYQRARRLSPLEKDKVHIHINDWMREGIIQPSLSDYASPIVLVSKKNGSTRLCVDYRELNKKIIKDRYPLPLIDDELDALQGASVYSTLDLKNGFFHVPVHPESRKYTSFITTDGQFEFLYVPFGLCNSPAVFQRFINVIFRDLIKDKIVLTYMDDLIIPTMNSETGLKNLENVLGVAFTSHEFEEYCKQSKIQHVLVTTGVPRGNGQVERLNRTLIPILSKLSSPKPQEWYKYLPLAQQYLNMTINRSTNTTPFKLLFGVHMKFKDNSEIKELIENELINNFQSERDELRIKAKDKILKIQEENRRNYNKKRKKAHRYNKNELVAIKRTQLCPGLKLASKYLGPYEIIRVLRNDRYIVKKIGNQEGPQQTTTSADHMKLWISDSDHSSDGLSDSDGYDDTLVKTSEDRCLVRMAECGIVNF